MMPVGETGYSGTPLGRKLGLKPGQTVELLGGPADFVDRLGKYGAGIRFRRRSGARADGAVLFCRTQRDLDRRLTAAMRDTAAGDRTSASAKAAAGGWIWIAWPKKASGLATDLSDAAVRKTGLDRGMVDSKVCAIDAVWSALRFTPRRT